MSDKKTRAEEFKGPGRELEFDQDEDRWKERLKNLVKGKPVDRDGA